MDLNSMSVPEIAALKLRQPKLYQQLVEQSMGISDVADPARAAPAPDPSSTPADNGQASFFRGWSQDERARQQQQRQQLLQRLQARDMAQGLK